MAPDRASTSALSIRGWSLHIGRMAKSPSKSSPQPAEAPNRRRRPLTEFLDAAEPLQPKGFSEAPQAAFTGAPLKGTVADWAEQIALEAEQDGLSLSPSKEEAGKPSKSKKIPERSAAPTKTARGTSMGGAATARERAAAGLNPVAGLDIALEDAEQMSSSGVTATVAALSALIESGNPLHKDGKLWTPHRPARPEKSEGGIAIVMQSDFEPAGDQPTAIKDLVEGVSRADRTQVLLGVTGSGKTFTMAKVIEETQRPALILAPNKTLAAQLYSEFKKFFPDNAVEYFVSYYDYYQPEAYVPRTDTYIEKESSINEQIDRMRHSATRSLLERDDVIIVASVSCIYGIGSVETYTAMTFQMQVGDRLDQRALLADLVAQQYKRQDINFVRGSFRVRGDTIEIFPAHLEDSAWRITMFGDEIETITEFDPLTGQKTGDLKSVKIYANSHYVTPRPTLNQAIKSIKEELVAPPRRAGEGRPAAGSAAAGAAHPLRPRDAGGDRLLRRHRELFALPHRPPAGRAAADPVRIHPRQRADLHRREPRHRAADRRHVSRRLPPQGDARRIRLSPALLHGQPAAALRGMGRHAPALGRGLGDARQMGDGSRPAASLPSR